LYPPSRRLVSPQFDTGLERPAGQGPLDTYGQASLCC